MNAVNAMMGVNPVPLTRWKRFQNESKALGAGEVCVFAITLGDLARAAFLEWPLHCHLHTVQCITSPPIHLRSILAKQSYSWDGFWQLSAFVVPGQIAGALVLYSYRCLLRGARWCIDLLVNRRRPSFLFLRTAHDRVQTSLDVSKLQADAVDIDRLTSHELTKSYVVVLETVLGDVARFFDAFAGSSWQRILENVLVTAVMYPFIVAATRAAFAQGEFRDVLTLPMSKLYAGVVPRIGAVVVQYAVGAVALHYAAKAFRSLATLSRLWHVPGRWLLRPWVAASGLFFGAILLSSFGDYCARPLNLLSARARMGMYPASAVASVGGCVRELRQIVRTEGFWCVHVLWGRID
jgi:hypothetical protein